MNYTKGHVYCYLEYSHGFPVPSLALIALDTNFSAVLEVSVFLICIQGVDRILVSVPLASAYYSQTF